MNFLSINCSMDLASLFIKAKNKTFSKILQNDKSYNDLLMKQILDFFKENNIKFEDISEIFVNQGPGSFSAIRGSLSTAKGISIAKKIKLYGYNTFLWSCAKFLNKNDSIHSFIKFREKYFLKIFDKNLKRGSKIKEINKNDIIKEYNKKFKVITKQASKSFDEKILKLDNLNIVDLDHNELQSLKLKGLLEKNAIKPLYLF